MAYKDTPIATNAKNASQSAMKENFALIKTFTEADHVTFGDPNIGKHKYVTYIKQDDDPATDPDEMIIYNKDNALYIQPQSKAIGTDGIDFTSYTNDASQGCTTLPSGLLLCWGSANLAIAPVDPSHNTSATFKKAYAVGSPFQVVPSISGIAGTNASNLGVETTFNATTVYFTRANAEIALTLRYFAIGIGA